MVNLVLPSIGDEFGASEAELAWMVTGLLLVFSVGIPFYGRLSDRVSLRKLFSFALVTYATSPELCARTTSIPALARRVNRSQSPTGLER